MNTQISLFDEMLDAGIHPEIYFELLEQNATMQHDESTMTEDERNHARFYPINFQRTSRILNTLPVSTGIAEKIKRQEKQFWLVITEPWCGDSSQSLPVMAKLAELNPNIDFRIILRDKNPDIMNQFLTNGTKSIPLLIIFDENGNQIGKWGPRPKDAVKLFAEGKAQGLVKDDILVNLHAWYGKNKGQQIQEEIAELLG